MHVDMRDNALPDNSQTDILSLRPRQRAQQVGNNMAALIHFLRDTYIFLSHVLLAKIRDACAGNRVLSARTDSFDNRKKFGNGNIPQRNFF